MSDRPTLPERVEDWFQGQGFTRAVFSSPTERITTFNMGHMLVFKLRERPEHIMFYKEAAGGSLIVFEVSVVNGKIQYTGYCPLLLFGIWERKLTFKAGAGKLASYRKEGFDLALRLKRMLEERSL